VSGGLARRLRRLETDVGRAGICPQHDLTIGVRRIKDESMMVTREPDRRRCRRCGRPASAFWIELVDVPSRHRDDAA
jgi:hypothetical protein